MLVVQYYAISGLQYGGREVNGQRTIYFITQLLDYVWCKVYKAFENTPKYFDIGLENRVAYMAFQNNADVSNMNYSSPFNLRMNCCIDLKFARNTYSKDIQNI